MKTIAEIAVFIALLFCLFSVSKMDTEVPKSTQVVFQFSSDLYEQYVTPNKGSNIATALLQATTKKETVNVKRDDTSSFQVRNVHDFVLDYVTSLLK